MGCGELQRELIVDAHQRRMTYHRRKRGLMKKVEEFATLCDVQALLICSGPGGAVDVWPSSKREVEDIIGRYRGSGQVRRDRHRHDTDPVRRRTGIKEVARGARSKLEAVRRRIQYLAGRRRCVSEHAIGDAATTTTTGDDCLQPKFLQFL